MYIITLHVTASADASLPDLVPGTSPAPARNAEAIAGRPPQQTPDRARALSDSASDDETQAAAPAATALTQAQINKHIKSRNRIKKNTGTRMAAAPTRPPFLLIGDNIGLKGPNGSTRRLFERSLHDTAELWKLIAKHKHKLPSPAVLVLEFVYEQGCLVYKDGSTRDFSLAGFKGSDRISLKKLDQLIADHCDPSADYDDIIRIRPRVSLHKHADVSDNDLASLQTKLADVGIRIKGGDQKNRTSFRLGPWEELRSVEQLRTHFQVDATEALIIVVGNAHAYEMAKRLGPLVESVEANDFFALRK